MATILKTNRNRNPPKKILRISNPSDAEDLMAFHCLLPLGDPSGSHSSLAVSQPFSSATPASSGSFHCMLPLGYPSDSSPAVYPLVPALQLQHHRRFHCCRFHLVIHPARFLTGCISTVQLCNSSIASRDIGFHCCRFHLKIHPVQFLTGCISTIASLQFQPRRGTTTFPTLLPLPDASSRQREMRIGFQDEAKRNKVKMG